MEAKAPEKIYVHIRQKPCEITFSEVIEKGCSNIEYIRTDAFIEKAVEWLNSVFKANMGYYAGSQAIEDFKNYMKG